MKKCENPEQLITLAIHEHQSLAAGQSPTRRELAMRLGKSLGWVQHHLVRMSRAGLLDLRPAVPRGITMINLANPVNTSNRGQDQYVGYYDGNRLE